MSENSKELQELLIELEYGELDEIAAVEAQEQIDADPAMRAMQESFRAVRTDLHAVDEPEVSPSRIAFVTMPGQPAANTWSIWAKGAAVAASFAFGLLLAAAAANTFGLMPAMPGVDPALAGAPDATAETSFASMSQSEIQDYLDSRYARADAITTPVADMSPEELRPIVDDLWSEREQQWRGVVQQMLNVANRQQRDEIETLMAGMFQTFDAARTNDMLAVADELGILQQNTGAELQRNTQAIDYLFTRVGLDPTGQREQDND
ncbi:MAG: hypothetical protein GKS06_14425 [Acidobacteria bacterium]|nr:hypothetical protein [Acidobacteriota bacterium]